MQVVLSEAPLIRAQSIRQFATSLLELVYPQPCGGCGAFGSGLWCSQCNARLVRFDAAQSIRQLPSPPLPHPCTVISACPYLPPVRDAIHAFKYRGTPQLADVFAGWLFEAWQTQGCAADCVVPVPLHPARERERGFNQSAALGRAFARRSSMRCVIDALQRKRRTQQQASLSAADRAANISGAFSANRRLLQGLRVVIIDDVFTTGATLSECAATCLAAGAKEVIALSIARADDI